MNFITLLKKFTTRTTTNRKGFIKKIKRNKIHEKYGPNPNELFPNPNIIVGDYTYYDDPNGAKNFEKHVTHHYDFNGDKLIICADSVVAAEKITENLGTLCSGDLTKLKKIK